MIGGQLDFVPLKYRSYRFARRKQDELEKRYGFKPTIMHLKREDRWLVLKPKKLLLPGIINTR